ncbi:MAG: regulatory protein RecX [Bacteroidia bacterium]|nr:regulatory protein RecX [Bacteroidia bacterium]
MEKKKYISEKDALIKVAGYCAYQERCHKEVREKLSELGVFGLEADEMLLRLIQDNYVNEERFAKSYAGGKFRVKQWGKQKIKRELKLRNISDYCIRQALNEIDEDDYLCNINELIQHKYKTVKAVNDMQRKYKTAQYMLAKGYENDPVWDCLKAF